MKIIDLEIGSPEWHAYRNQRIGASDSAAILGISPFSTPLKTYENKVLGKSVESSFSMKRGQDREAEALKWATNELEIDFKPCIVQSEFDWKFATMDGFNKFEKVAIEIKWANSIVHNVAKKGAVIDYYYPQVQSQMFCCNLEWMYFLSCYQQPGEEPDFVLTRVDRDDKFIDNMLKKESEFYYNHMLLQVPPPATEKDHVTIKNDFIFDMLCDNEKEISKKIKEMEDERNLLKKKIVELCESRSSVSEKYRITKSFVRGRIDYDQIEVLKDVNLDLYRKEGTEAWRITKI